MEFNKIKLYLAEVQGHNYSIDFHTINTKRDVSCVLITKWCSVIETLADMKTVDEFARSFVISFTTKASDLVKANCSAKAS